MSFGGGGGRFCVALIDVCLAYYLKLLHLGDMNVVLKREQVSYFVDRSESFVFIRCRMESTGQRRNDMRILQDSSNSVF